jgi:hypothetical protein
LSMKLAISRRLFLTKLPISASRAEIITTDPITGLYAANVVYCCEDPLKMLSAVGAFQRVQRREPVEPRPDASMPHQGRKTLASARAPARIETRLILGNLI